MGLGHIMTLANSIIGVSVLAMPFCFKQCGIILSILVLFLSSIMTRLACHFLLKAAVLARRRNYEFLAFHAFGPKGKLMVELCVIGFLFGTCIAFFVVMGDLGPAIISEVLGISKSPSIRSSVLLGLALLVVLPLGLLRNVDSLSSLCTATILFYFFLVLKIMSEATTHLLAGDWLQYVHLWRPAGILQCIPIFAMALSCQTQVFEIYETLPDPSLPKMNEVVRAAVNICTGVYVCMGFFGYVAVCRPPASSVMGDMMLAPPAPTLTGNILMSFPSSFTMQAIKLFFVASVACSFPLVIFPCRASLHSLLFRRVPHHETGIGASGSGGGAVTASTASLLPPGSSGGPAVERIPERRFRLLTVSLVAGSLAVAFALPDIELVLGLVGSSIGTITCLLLPALCFLKVAPSHPYRHSHWGGGKGVTAERLLAQVMIVVGTTILILSTYANLHAVDQARGEEPITPHPLQEGGAFPKAPGGFPPGQLAPIDSNIINPEVLPKAIQGVESGKKIVHVDNPLETVKQLPSGGKKESDSLKALVSDNKIKEVKPEKRQEPPVPVAPDHGVKKIPLPVEDEKPKKAPAKKVEVAKSKENQVAVESVGKKGGEEGGRGEEESVGVGGAGKNMADSIHGDAIKKEEEEVGIEEGAAEREEERRQRQEEEEKRKGVEKERREKELLQKLADDRKKQQEQINIQMEILKKLQALEGKKSEPEKNGTEKKSKENAAVESKPEKKDVDSGAPAVLEEKSIPVDKSKVREKLMVKDGGIAAEVPLHMSNVNSVAHGSPVLETKELKKTELTKSQAVDGSQNEVLVKNPDDKVSVKESDARVFASNLDKASVKEEGMKVASTNVSSISQMKAALPMPLLLGGGQQENILVKGGLKTKDREKREVEFEVLPTSKNSAIQDEGVESAVKEREVDNSEKVNLTSQSSDKMVVDSYKGVSSSDSLLVNEVVVSSFGDVNVEDSYKMQESKEDPKVKYNKLSDEKVMSTPTKPDVAAVDNSKGTVASCVDKDATTHSPLLCTLRAKELDSYLSPTIKTPLKLSDPVEGKSSHENIGTKVGLNGVIMEVMPMKRDLKYIKVVDEDSINKTEGH